MLLTVDLDVIDSSNTKMGSMLHVINIYLLNNLENFAAHNLTNLKIC